MFGIFKNKDAEEVASEINKIHSQIYKLAKKNTNFTISISHTTRKPRPNEINGYDYYFVSNKNIDDYSLQEDINSFLLILK